MAAGNWSVLPEVLKADGLLLKMHFFHLNPDVQIVSPYQNSWITYVRLVSTSVFRLSFVFLPLMLLIPLSPDLLFLGRVMPLPREALPSATITFHLYLFISVHNTPYSSYYRGLELSTLAW